MSAFAIGSATDRGVKGRNEDWVLSTVWRFASREGDVEYGVLLVLDGVTMSGAGQLASATAGGVISSTILHYLTHHHGVPPFSRALSARRIIDTALDQAHREIRGVTKLRPEYRALSTTAVVAVMQGRTLWFGSAGDSRLYLCRRGTWELLTRDHSRVARLVESGAMTPEEAAVSPDRHQIFNAIGIEHNFFCETGEIEVEPGDVVLGCTDGVHEYLDPRSVTGAASCIPPDTGDLGDWCRSVVESAYDAGSDDNLGLAACRVDQVARVASGLPETVLRYGERWRPASAASAVVPGGQVDGVEPVASYGSETIPDHTSLGART